MPAELAANLIEAPAETCRQIVAHGARARDAANVELEELRRSEHATHGDGILLLQQLLTNVNELIGAAANESAADPRGGGLQRDEH